MTGVLIRKNSYTHTHKKEEGHMKMETEMRVMWPQAKGDLGPPEAGRGFGGKAALISDFSLWNCCFKPPSHGQPQETNTNIHICLFEGLFYFFKTFFYLFLCL